MTTGVSPFFRRSGRSSVDVKVLLNVSLWPEIVHDPGVGAERPVLAG